MSTSLTWSRLEDLEARALHAIAQLRVAVFVVEQRCAYAEIDDHDLEAWHLQVHIDGVLAAYARVLPPGRAYAEPAIGRVCTAAAFRGRGLGHVLVREAVRFTEGTYPGRGIRLAAQAHLQPFYASAGFMAEGAVYEEDGIAHITMHRPAATQVVQG